MQELKGIRGGQADTQKVGTNSSQQQQQTPQNGPKETAAASNSETLLPQINYKQ